MQRKVAVILAYNLGNCGMYSVDIAALAAFAGVEVDFFSDSPQPKGTYFKEHDVILYPGVRRLGGYDAIIFWGDFTTSPYYGVSEYYWIFNSRKSLLPKAVRSAAIYKRLVSNSVLIEWADRYLPVDGCPPVFSIGQNFQIIGDAVDKVYREYSTRYALFEEFIVRDSVSCDRLRDRVVAPVVLGCDAALVAESTPLRPQTRKKVGILLGRSRIGGLRDAILRLSKELSFEIVTFDEWHQAEGSVKDAYYSNINKMICCDLVITDTYHFAINATLSGIPVIGIGNKVETQTGTLGDFKKLVLFKDLGISENYLEISNFQAKDSDVLRLRALAALGFRGCLDVGRFNLTPIIDLVRRITK